MRPACSLSLTTYYLLLTTYYLLLTTYYLLLTTYHAPGMLLEPVDPRVAHAWLGVRGEG
jgi:hypothetical protein